MSRDKLETTGDESGATRRVSPFLAWGDFHARSRFGPSTIPEEKWGTTRSLSGAGPWQDVRTSAWEASVAGVR